MILIAQFILANLELSAGLYILLNRKKYLIFFFDIEIYHLILIYFIIFSKYILIVNPSELNRQWEVQQQ